MTTHSKSRNEDEICVEFDQLSKGVDQILGRWTGSDRPTKLTLLNDLAAAIQPGANWGALKAAASTKSPPLSLISHANLVPHVPKAAIDLPARLSPVRCGEDDLMIADLAEDVQALFSLKHDGDSIIGLTLSVADGNGYCDASIWNRLILQRDGIVYTKSVHALDLAPDVARLIYGAIQNLQSTDLYPIFGQAACGRLHILLGPSQCVASLPQALGRDAPVNIPSQGLRLLFDEGEAPSAADIDVLLRLASAALPHLGLKGFPTDKPVQFKLSQPLSRVWKQIDFQFSPHLDDRPMFRKPGTENWAHFDDFLIGSGIETLGILGEPLDLALALVDVDDADVYLKVSLTPVPKNLRRSTRLKPGWRGGFHRRWDVLRLRAGEPAEILSLESATRKRLETGLNGWAIHEGYSVTDDLSLVKAEALIARRVRRASHHMKQVEAIMNGADPTDQA